MRGSSSSPSGSRPASTAIANRVGRFLAADDGVARQDEGGAGHRAGRLGQGEPHVADAEPDAPVLGAGEVQHQAERRRGVLGRGLDLVARRAVRGQDQGRAAQGVERRELLIDEIG